MSPGPVIWNSNQCYRSQSNQFFIRIHSFLIVRGETSAGQIDKIAKIGCFAP